MSLPVPAYITVSVKSWSWNNLPDVQFTVTNCMNVYKVHVVVKLLLIVSNKRDIEHLLLTWNYSKLLCSCKFLYAFTQKYSVVCCFCYV